MGSITITLLILWNQLSLEFYKNKGINAARMHVHRMPIRNSKVNFVRIRKCIDLPLFSSIYQDACTCSLIHCDFGLQILLTAEVVTQSHMHGDCIQSSDFFFLFVCKHVLFFKHELRVRVEEFLSRFVVCEFSFVHTNGNVGSCSNPRASLPRWPFETIYLNESMKTKRYVRVCVCRGFGYFAIKKWKFIALELMNYFA